MGELRRRTPLERRAPLRRSKPKRRPVQHRDPVTIETRLAVMRRDGGCVAPKLDGAAGDCADRWGGRVVVIRTGSGELLDYGALTLDHVRDQPMMGKRAPSDPAHLVTLCWHHHLDGWATRNRPLLRRYLASVS